MAERNDILSKQALRRERGGQLLIKGVVVAVYLLVTAISFLFTLWNAGFDFAKIQWGAMVGDVLIFWAITTILLTVSFFDGNITFKQGIAFLKAVDEVKSLVSTVMFKGLNFAFRQYSHEDYIKRRREYMANILLMDGGLANEKVMDLNKEQLEELLKNPMLIDIDGKEEAFDIISPEQYILVMDVKSGKFKYEEISADWYLTVSSGGARDRYNKYANYDKNSRKRLAGQFVLRLFMIFMVVFLFSGIYLSEGNVSQTVALIKALSRVLSAIMAIASGYLLAYSEVQENIGSLEFRKEKMDSFMSDYTSGIFVPKTLNDVVKEKLKKDIIEDIKVDDKDRILLTNTDNVVL